MAPNSHKVRKRRDNIAPFSFAYVTKQVITVKARGEHHLEKVNHMEKVMSIKNINICKKK